MQPIFGFCSGVVYTMVLCKVLCVFSLLVLNVLVGECQFLDTSRYNAVPKAIPFPSCRMDDIECLRRGLRTFFFLMDSGHFGMKPVDPAIINSVSVALPEQQMSFLMRNINVTGTRWTKLIDRKFDLVAARNLALFSSDLHITGDIIVTAAERVEPMVAFLTMDTQSVLTNITYSWRGERGIDNFDYIVLGRERIAVRNSRIPTFFLQPDSEESKMIEQVLQSSPSILDHLSNEITISIMHSVFDNFKLFSSTVPIHQYYKLYKK